ncbi:MAG: leucine-rich repeat protein [Candidatus Coproplasma sp.]
MIVFEVVGILLGVITFALELVGLLVYTSVALSMLKVIFYVSIAIIILLIVVFGFGISDELFGIWGISGILVIALITIGIVTLAGGRLGFKSFTVSEQYGVVYVETKTEYRVWKIEDKVEDVYIMTSIDGKNVTEINKKAARGNEKIVSLTFEEGNLIIGKNAFKDCGRLETISFADNSKYTLDDGVFEGCIRLKEIDAGSAEISNLSASGNATLKIDGGNVSSSSSMNTVIVSNNKSVFSFGKYVDPVTPKTVVFEDGFNFGDGTYESYYYTTGFFTKTYHYTSIGQTIYLPDTITTIPDYFFGDEGSSCKVYYAGSAEDWAKLSIGSTGNSNYSNGKIKMEYNTPYTAG